MGYDVVITRSTARHPTQAPGGIPRREWTELVDTLRVASLAASARLAWRDGRVVAKTPDAPLRKRMVAFAKALDARVVGDDGEVYWPRPSATKAAKLVRTLLDVAGAMAPRQAALRELMAMGRSARRSACSLLLEKLLAIGDPVFVEDCPEVTTLLRHWHDDVVDLVEAVADHRGSDIVRAALGEKSRAPRRPARRLR